MLSILFAFAVCRARYQQDSIACDMCKAVIDYVEDLLHDKQTEEEITKLVLALCEVLPEPLKSNCKLLGADYVQLIIQYLQSGIEQLEICRRIGLCDVRKPVKNEDDCEKCLSMVPQVRELLDKGMTREEIIDSLDKHECDPLEEPLSTLCKFFIHTFANSMIDLIEENKNDKTICTILFLCPETKRPTVRMYPKINSYIRKLVLEGKSDEEIIREVQILQNSFPNQKKFDDQKLSHMIIKARKTQEHQ